MPEKIWYRAVRKGRKFEQVHWAIIRKGLWPVMLVFAFDHRSQLKEVPDARPEKQICLKGCACNRLLRFLNTSVRSDCVCFAERIRPKVVKDLCFTYQHDADSMSSNREEIIVLVFQLAQHNWIDFLLEFIPSKAGAA